MKAGFGPEVVGDDGEVNRKVLGSIVFGDKSQMQLLNSIVWPVIRAKLQIAVDEQIAAGTPVVVIEAAVLLEAGWADMMDAVWVLCVEPETAVERIMARNSLSREAAQTRVDAQMKNDARISAAGIGAAVFWNNSTKEALATYVEEKMRWWNRT